MQPDGAAWAGPPALCVVMHDVAPATWPQCERLLQALRRVSPHPTTFLVVPEYFRGAAARGDAAFCRMLEERRRGGDELAVHGFKHHDDEPARGWREQLRRRFYTNAEGEFSALDQVQAERRVAAGVDWFRSQGWPLTGFVAPAWLMSPGTVAALEASPFRYTSTLNEIWDLPRRRRLAAPSLVYSARSPWRRRLSHHWLTTLAPRLKAAPVIRLGLHPIDADHPEVVRDWQRLLEQLLATRAAVTKADYLLRWAGQPDASERSFVPA